MENDLEHLKELVVKFLKDKHYYHKKEFRYLLKLILELFRQKDELKTEIVSKEKIIAKKDKSIEFWKREASKIEKQLINSNTKLVDENKVLKKDNEILEKRINKALKIIEKYRNYNVIPEELENVLKGVEE